VFQLVAARRLRRGLFRRVVVFFASVTAVLAGLVAGPMAQEAGAPLPPWQPGNLDIHVINTARGDAALLILPDGTTLQFDAGDGGAIPGTPRGVPPVYDTSRPIGERIARYITRVVEHFREPALDYALVSHLHDDHMGAYPELARHLPIGTLLDRGWPDYGPPAPPSASSESSQRYLAFVRANADRMARFVAGRDDQITLRRAPQEYPEFTVRNIAVNGEVWTGVGHATRSRFPENWQALPAVDHPTENQSSLGIRVSYGRFDFYTGGDIPGMVRPGYPSWQDIETPVAQAVGAVDVAAVNHHGNRDSTNAYFVAALQPRVWILQVWSSDHPAHDVLDRMLSRRLYPGDRDVLATNMSPANRAVIGTMLDQLRASRGHIVIRVDRGGETYRAFVLDDADESLRVTAVHGPYRSR
jgi:beta-lactamase superfamily II metal-dependent hydrolase